MCIFVSPEQSKYISQRRAEEQQKQMGIRFYLHLVVYAFLQCRAEPHIA
jgi:hypothetical protein